MSLRADLGAALGEAGLDLEIARLDDLTGGCMHRVVRLTLAGERRLVAKINDPSRVALFEEEADGLRALLDTKTVRAPQPLVAGVFGGSAVLLMTVVEVGEASDASWRRFGAELAALHDADVGPRYGFAADNHLGMTPQVNTWTDDWVEFNAEHRLGHQVRLAGDRGHLAADEIRLLHRVIDRLASVIPRRPRPSLLHGDLWSGNVLPAAGGRIAVIDPACSIGDGWADIAMMQLFGGIPACCVEAYVAEAGQPPDLDGRIGVYQLYHVLNHVNLFGRGYAAQAAGLARRLVG